MTRRGIVALVVLLAGFAPAQERARKVALVIVAPEPGLEKTALAVHAAARAHLEKDTRFELIDLAVRSRSAADAPMAARAKAGKEAFEKGLSLLDALEYGQANEQLGLAVKAYLESDLTAHFPALLEAIGTRAVALRLGGNGAAGAAELTRLYTLNPDYRLSPGRWPPVIQGWLDQRQTAVRSLATVTLEVTCPSGPAELFVDGKYRGVTPFKVRELVPGKHLLTLRASGYATRQLEVTVTAGAGASAAPRLEPTPEGTELLAHLEALRAGFRAGSVDQPGRALVAWSQADEVMAISLQNKGDQLWATATRLSAKGQLALQARSLGRTSEPALEDVGPLAVSTLTRLGSDALAPPPEVAGSGSRRVWGVVSVSAGVAAGAGAVLAGLAAQQRAKEARMVPQVDEAAYRAAVASARGTALASDGLSALALAGAGVGLYLLLSAAPPAEANATAGPVTQLRLVPTGPGLALSGAF